MCCADRQPSFSGDIERGRSSVSRFWPVVAYFALVGLGGTASCACVFGAHYPLGVSCGVFLDCFRHRGFSAYLIYSPIYYFDIRRHLRFLEE